MLFFGINAKKLNELGVLNLNGLAEADSLDATKLTSEEHLFCRLWASNMLRSELFAKGDMLQTAGESVSMAHIIFHGEAAVCEGKQNKFLLGPGSVIGLAEGLAQIPARWSVKANSLLITRIIPIDKAIHEVAGTNAGLRSICRLATMRTLELHKTPEVFK